MKKRILSLLPIITLAVVVFIPTASCDKAKFDMSWKELTGSGVYHSQTNTSSIKLTGIVEFDTPSVANDVMTAQILSWRFVVLQGDIVVLYISDQSLYSVLGDVIFSKSENQSDFVWVMIETLPPKAGDIFQGATPDALVCSMEIVDNHGNVYEVENPVPVSFEFTRV